MERLKLRFIPTNRVRDIKERARRREVEAGRRRLERGSRANISRDLVRPLRLKRDQVRLSERQGRTIEVHNGRTWVPFQMTEEKIGYRAGDFVSTRPIGKRSKRGKRK